MSTKNLKLGAVCLLNLLTQEKGCTSITKFPDVLHRQGLRPRSVLISSATRPGSPKEMGKRLAYNFVAEKLKNEIAKCRHLKLLPKMPVNSDGCGLGY